MDQKKFNALIDNTELLMWLVVVSGTAKATNQTLLRPFLKKGGWSGKMTGNLIALCYGIMVAGAVVNFLDRKVAKPMKRAHQKQSIDAQEG